MKIQFLNGGLANQAFQYIFARYYELSHPGEIMYMDDSYFALNTVHNGYELEKVFGIKPHMLSECFDKDVWDFILQQRREGKSIPQILLDNGMPIQMITETGNYKQFNPFNGQITGFLCFDSYTDILEIPGDIYYHGYWIDQNWFDRYREVFLQEFSFHKITDARNLAYLDWIQNTNSVSLHIRRGDFVTLGWAMEASDYQTMIKKFVDSVPGKWELFVFSDDIGWCRDNQKEMGFHLFHKVTYVEGNTQGKNYIDLQLMSQCKAMIMSNSAFCYLAALLNTKKQVYLNPTDRQL